MSIIKDKITINISYNNKNNNSNNSNNNYEQ